MFFSTIQQPLVSIVRAISPTGSSLRSHRVGVDDLRQVADVVLDARRRQRLGEAGDRLELEQRVVEQAVGDGQRRPVEGLRERLAVDLERRANRDRLRARSATRRARPRARVEGPLRPASTVAIRRRSGHSLLIIPLSGWAQESIIRSPLSRWKTSTLSASRSTPGE